MTLPSSSHPPLLLRLLHGLNGILVVLAWLTGLLVYSRFDGRWGRLPFPISGEWIEIHGSIGVVLLPVALLFALYAVTAGRWRLRQAANAVPLLALLLAVGSGKLMQEDWLEDGQFDHLVYHLHLLAWLLIAAAVIWHVVALLRRGGPALLRSMVGLGEAPQQDR